MRAWVLALLGFVLVGAIVATFVTQTRNDHPAVITAAPTTAAAPAPPNTLTPAEQAAGWKLLFDGKTTAGWRGYRQDKVPDGWQVIDGALDRVRNCGDLITLEKYASFELTADWRIAPGGNSGIMYHITEDYPEPGMSGPECQILDNVGGEDPQKAGWCYGLYRPPIDPKTGQPLDATHPAGQWNTTRLLVDGPHVTHWMNGVKYVEYDLWSDDWNQRVAHSKFTAWPKFARAKSGYICLQDHGAEVAFRNVKIRVIGKADGK
ncbi:MAG TPA: DUF1080 domain-containing protein [Tepidisphaeraceae bacterium]|jgi:hypothetical protein